MRWCQERTPLRFRAILAWPECGRPPGAGRQPDQPPAGASTTQSATTQSALHGRRDTVGTSRTHGCAVMMAVRERRGLRTTRPRTTRP